MDTIVKVELPIEDKLPKTVIDAVKSFAEDYLSDLVDGIEECESPIEQMLFLGLKDPTGYFYKLLDRFFFLDISAQEEVMEGKYRTDFTIKLLREGGKDYVFAIECDSKEFHLNEESFVKDRQRDLKLLSCGIITLRVTGKDILERPKACARDIYKTIYEFIVTQEGDLGE